VTVKSRLGGLACCFALAASSAAPELAAQTATMPSTLRYGSGLMDTPVSSVLRHMTITGTVSGFFVDLPRTLEIDGAGNAVGFGPPSDAFYQDASLAVGLFDRLEVGTTIQSLNEAAEGGDVWGLFGRLRLMAPAAQGVGLAVGGRYVTAPDFGPGVDAQPNRLGTADERFREAYTGGETVSTEVSIYGVASAYIAGRGGGLFPAHNMTLSLGYGTGMFQEGGGLGFYQSAGSGGWFFGSALHLGLGSRAVLTFMGEYNGFDVNVGAQLDVNGIRLGAQYLAANYPEPVGGYDSEYRSPKLGIMASLALCPLEGVLCMPRLMEAPAPDTVWLPAPPPDTVLITRGVERPLPEGTPASVCLATGESVLVHVTPRGDTLVGPDRTSIRLLRPGVLFAGAYAAGREWLANGAPITFQARSYRKTGDELRLDCRQIVRVGSHGGVPLFARPSTGTDPGRVFVPVRPGLWQAYERGSPPARQQRRDEAGAAGAGDGDGTWVGVEPRRPSPLATLPPEVLAWKRLRTQRGVSPPGPAREIDGITS
jgi:hypothetical protein